MRLGVSRTRGDPGKARQRLLTSRIGGDKISAIPTEEFFNRTTDAPHIKCRRPWPLVVVVCLWAQPKES